MRESVHATHRKTWMKRESQLLRRFVTAVHSLTLTESEDIRRCAPATWQGQSHGRGSPLQLGTGPEPTARGRVRVLRSLSAHPDSRVRPRRAGYRGMDA